MKTRHISYITGTFILLSLLQSCSREPMASSGDTFVIKAIDSGMKTKGDFGENTAYRFFAYKVVEGNQVLQEPYISNAVGTEDTNGIVGFDESVKDYFEGNTLDFYGLTLGTSSVPSEAVIESYRPKYTLSRNPGGSLPDLRRGVLLNQTSINSGNITVPFRHALSRLKFTIVRQSEDHLNNAEITYLAVDDHESGILDVIGGEWALSPETGTYSLLDAPARIREESSDEIASCLIFPGESISVHVSVDVPENTTLPEDQRHLNKDLTIDSSMIPGDSGFRQNYEYTVSIAVVNNNIKIVMVVPTMFPWMDEPESDDLALGQPITFGGVTWADKNLGAESSTYANVEEWDKMRGFYYQFGRNIPYFVLPTNTYNGYSYTYTPSYGSANNPRTAAFPLISKYSIQDAQDAIAAYEKVYSNGSKTWPEMGGVVSNNGQTYTSHYPLGYYTQSQKNGFGKNLPVFPDQWEGDGYTWEQLKANQSEIDKYCFVKGDFNENQPWWYYANENDRRNAPRTWDNPKTQPCPKGWRVPTKDDWASIMPLSKRTGDICFMNSSGGTTNDQSIRDAYGKDIKIGAGNQEFVLHAGKLWWYEPGGDRRVTLKVLEEDYGDPYGDFRTDYLCVREDTDDNTFGTLYAIKCVETSSAYRLRWQYIVLSGSSYKDVATGSKYPVLLEICRYPASITDRLTDPSQVANYDWEHYSERIVFPICGYLYPNTTPVVTNAALESNYASSTVDSDGYFYYVRMKHSTSKASRYLMLFKMRRSYGMSIRCVKDNTVTIE